VIFFFFETKKEGIKLIVSDPIFIHWVSYSLLQYINVNILLLSLSKSMGMIKLKIATDRNWLSVHNQLTWLLGHLRV